MNEQSTQVDLHKAIIESLKQQRKEWLLAREPMADEDPSYINMAAGEHDLFIEEPSHIQLEAIASIAINAIAATVVKEGILK